MSDSRKRKRDAWFKHGVEALALARPDAPRVYCCPFCLLGYDNPGQLTLEDVPPKSIGGKPLILTCAKCNNTHGHLLDSHIKSGRKLQEIASGKSITWARMKLLDNEVTAKARFGSDSIEVMAVPDKSDPKAHAAMFAEFEQLVAAKSLDWRIELGFSILYDKWREGVGWLRVAYLYLFALLGYNFILRPELKAIRDQFLKPDERLVPQVMKHTGEATASNGVSFVYEPAHLRSILVRLGRNLFFFPEFREAETFYDRLADTSPAKGEFRLSGMHLDLPRQPIFAFDYHRQAILETVPPELRPKPGGCV